jgi:hypothetical protein
VSPSTAASGSMSAGAGADTAPPRAATTSMTPPLHPRANLGENRMPQ